jgi:Na+-transporting methylmalonyl-CoA/oxaloacetate decarboxylase gamma subunit
VTTKRRRRTGGKGPPFDIDRVVVLRIAIAGVAVVFLYLILKVSMIAFGGSSARETQRIERAVDPATAARPVEAATAPRSGAAPSR